MSFGNTASGHEARVKTQEAIMRTSEIGEGNFRSLGEVPPPLQKRCLNKTLRYTTPVSRCHLGQDSGFVVGCKRSADVAVGCCTERIKSRAVMPCEFCD